jgi:hypothetical protein
VAPPLLEVAEEGLAEEVGRAAGRPAVEGHRGAVLPREVVLEGGHAQHHAAVRVAAAPEGSLLRLLEGGQALDEPRRGGAVREEEGGAAQHPAQGARKAARLLDVHDVQELVAEQQAEPALVVAQLVRPVGGHRAQVDERVGQGRGEPVGVVHVVREHDVHVREGRRVPLQVAAEDLLGEADGLAGQRLQPHLVVHGHAGGAQRAEAERGGKAGRFRRPGGQDRGRREQRARARPHAGGGTAGAV